MSDPHNPMMDNQGRLWGTTTVSPAACRRGARIRANKYAAYFPATNPSNRQASVYDPKTGQVRADLHLLRDAPPAVQREAGHAVLQRRRPDDPLGQRQDVGDRRRTKKQSTGWCPTVLDTNGDGKITKPWNEPVGGGRAQNEGGGGGQLGKFDPKLDTRVNAGSYGIIVSPTDDSVWSAGTSYPGRFVRLELGSNPPETCKAEIYTIPDDKAPDPLRPARHRHRSRRRRVGGPVRQRRLRQLRSAEVQGVQRPVGRRRQAVPGGLDASIRWTRDRR